MNGASTTPDFAPHASISLISLLNLSQGMYYQGEVPMEWTAPPLDGGNRFFVVFDGIALSKLKVQSSKLKVQSSREIPKPKLKPFAATLTVRLALVRFRAWSLVIFLSFEL